METYTRELSEIIITPANNPAIKIIRNALHNKDLNNFYDYERYSYNCYVKTILDVKLSDDADALDSSKIINNERIRKHAAYLSECVITCLKAGNYSEKKIIAQKTSGFDELLVKLWVSMFHNSISFYNNSIPLFEMPISNNNSITEYLSPLSDKCIDVYNYQLQDTIINANDSIYIINYYPKKGKNFNSLKGKLYISTNGFALKTIIAEPNEKGLIDFKFKQEYMFTSGRWFPSRLDEEIGFVSKKVSSNINAYPVYLITSKTDSVQYDPDVSKIKKNHEKVYFDPGPIGSNDSVVVAARPDSMTTREKNTILYMERSDKKHNINTMFELLVKLATGKIPACIFDFDLFRLYSFNKYEGTRLGIGLYTNSKVSRYFSIGGFTGYGFNDKAYKYGGQVVFNLNKPRDIQLKLSFQNNLKEVGYDMTDDYLKLSINEYLRTMLGYRFDETFERKAEFSFRAFRFLKVSTSLSLKDIKPTYNYFYQGSMLTDYRADDIKFNAKYAYGLDIADWNDQKISNNTGNPIINLTYTRGLKIFNTESFKFNKLETTFDFSAYNGRIGQSDIRLAMGFIDRSLPYGMLFTGEGSKDNELPILINKSFQAMSPYEFLSDRYANLFYSHNFGSLLFSAKKFKPQFMVVQNSGWGSLYNSCYQGIDFKEKNKIYHEAGLVINNIVKIRYIKSLYLTLGIGGFYRYGYYRYDNFKDNLALKISSSFSLK